MALSEFTRKLVETKLRNFCREKISEIFRDRVRLGFRIDDDRVTLFEERLLFFDPSRWLALDVAQFRYHEMTNLWSLYYMDRDVRWHAYYLNPKRDFDILLREVDEDPVGVFWDDRTLMLGW
ncbi:MAG: DUF3024 domain-containing protein [Syntrophales bacterium]